MSYITIFVFSGISFKLVVFVKLRRYQIIGMNKNIKEINCPIEYLTPNDAAYFFGFHDLIPWNTNDNLLALLRVPKEIRNMPSCEDIAQICIWNPIEGYARRVGETTAWNWQQGSRLQWLPKANNKIIYNVRLGDTFATVFHDISLDKKDLIENPIYAISRDCRYGLSLNFGRLGVHWPAYGYSIANKSKYSDPLPDNDGIYIVNIESGKAELVVSIAQAASISATDAAKTMGHFFSHPTFNPSGTKFCFMHRFFTADKSLYSGMFVADRDGTNLKLIANEMCSHFDWYDDENLLLWTRMILPVLVLSRKSGLLGSPFFRVPIYLIRKIAPKYKQKLFKQAYYLINVSGDDKRVAVAKGLLDQDGHPMFTNDRQWIVTDTYPDMDGKQKLILYNFDLKTRYDIGEFYSPREYFLDVKCDLHPRWNNANNRVCIDTVQHGHRQVAIVDVTPVIGPEKLNSNRSLLGEEINR